MRSLSFFIILSFFCQSCELSERDLLAPIPGREVAFKVEITKWFNDHDAAIALNYDHGYPIATPFAYDALAIVLKNNIIMDYDVVSYDLLNIDTLKYFFKNKVIGQGLGYFGHGHKHDNHDAMSYDEAYSSFKLCYETMKNFGMKPISYAYPGGWGYHLRTRSALKDAGFLNGRKFEQLDISNPFIMANDEIQPKDWYALPTLIMQSEDYDGCIVCINNASELSEYLDLAIEKTAWLILTYHFIGDLKNYGFYYLPEFEKDLVAIKNRNLWNDKMDNITLYAYERKDATVEAFEVYDEFGLISYIKIRVEDNLPDGIYDQPLTIKIGLPAEWTSKNLIWKSSEENMITFKNQGEKLLLSILPNNTFYYLQPEVN